MAVTSGTQLGPYEIQSPIGAGGMGEVYRARDTRLGRNVAIKILPQTFASDPERLQRFQQEARVLSALNHPNLLAIYDVGVQDGVHYPPANSTSIREATSRKAREVAHPYFEFVCDLQEPTLVNLQKCATRPRNLNVRVQMAQMGVPGIPTP
jgi:serine/threonine protein kinase